MEVGGYTYENCNADEGAGGVVVGDVGGVLGQDVAHDLVDGVVALLLQRLVNGGQNVMNLHGFVLCGVEFAGEIFHGDIPPSVLCDSLYGFFPVL